MHLTKLHRQVSGGSAHFSYRSSRPFSSLFLLCFPPARSRSASACSQRQKTARAEIYSELERTITSSLACHSHPFRSISCSFANALGSRPIIGFITCIGQVNELLGCRRSPLGEHFQTFSSMRLRTEIDWRDSRFPKGN